MLLWDEYNRDTRAQSHPQTIVHGLTFHFQYSLGV